MLDDGVGIGEVFDAGVWGEAGEVVELEAAGGDGDAGHGVDLRAADVVRRVADDHGAAWVCVVRAHDACPLREADGWEVITGGIDVWCVLSPDADGEAVGVDAAGLEFDGAGVLEVACEQAEGEALGGGEGVDEGVDAGECGGGGGGVCECGLQLLAVVVGEGGNGVRRGALAGEAEDVGDDEGVELAGELDGFYVDALAEEPRGDDAHGADA